MDLFYITIGILITIAGIGINLTLMLIWRAVLGNTLFLNKLKIQLQKHEVTENNLIQGNIRLKTTIEKLTQKINNIKLKK